MNSDSHPAGKMDRADWYFRVWACFIPISSFVLIPAIQGTTPGFGISLLTLIVVPWIGYQRAGDYYKTVLVFGCVWLTFAACSQLGLMLEWARPDLSALTLINEEETQAHFRSSLFTQSLYLFCGISLFAFVKVYFKEKWIDYCMFGIMLFAAYGIYEWVYFLLTGSYGDFITNRVYTDMDTTGQWYGDDAILGFQDVQIGPFLLQRIKSLSGEPSMYAFTVLPFWIYAMHVRRWVPALVLLGTLIFSTSTTALIGIGIYFLFTFLDKKTIAFRAVMMVLVVVVVFLYGGYIMDTLNFMIFDKTSSDSGMQRWDNFTKQMQFFADSDIWVKLFGMGFGYARGTDFFSTLLVNCGALGVIVMSGFMLYPVYKLHKTRDDEAIRYAILILYISLMTSVPEFSYLPLWLFLGIGYARLSRKSSEVANHGVLPGEKERGVSVSA